MTDSFTSMVAYTRWADRTLLAPCAELTPAQYTLELGGSFPTLQATIAHLAGAAKLWSLRLGGLPYAGLLPAADIPDVATALARLGEACEIFEAVAPEWEANAVRDVHLPQPGGRRDDQAALADLPPHRQPRHLSPRPDREHAAAARREAAVDRPALLGRLVACWPRSLRIGRAPSSVRASSWPARRPDAVRAFLRHSQRQRERPTIAPRSPARRTARRAPEKDPHRAPPSGVLATRSRRYAFWPLLIFAHWSRSVTVRLKTRRSGVESRSTTK